MPEYLAPGVYVEEIDTGSKPIEGVSTSTAGMVGVTERGPVDVPILVTSNGEYQRLFGGLLDDAPDAFDGHSYLPHAVEGFFTNGGKRCYVVRVLDSENAQYAVRQLFDRGDGGVDSVLLRSAPEHSGTAANLPMLYVLDIGGGAANDWIRIGDGSAAEYRQIAANPADEAHVTVNFPLALPHAAGADVDTYARAPDTNTFTSAAFTLVTAVEEGDDEIEIQESDAGDAALLAPGQLIEIGGPSGEYHFIDSVDISGAQAVVTLTAEVAQAYAAGQSAIVIDTTAGPANSTILGLDARSGDLVFFIDPADFNDFDERLDIVVLDPGTADEEARRIGALSVLELEAAAYAAYPAGTAVHVVRPSDEGREVTTAANAGDAEIELDDVGDLIPGQSLVVGTAGNEETVTVQSVDETASTVTITAGLANAHAVGAPALLAVTTLSAAVEAGSRSIALNNRLVLEDGDLLRIGTAPDVEFAEIASIPGQTGIAPDGGTVVLAHPLQMDHVAGAEAVRQAVPADNARVITNLPGAPDVELDSVDGIVAGQTVIVGAPGNEQVLTVQSIDAAASTIEVPGLSGAHANGDPVLVSQAAFLMLDASDGNDEIIVTDGNGFSEGSIARVTLASGDVFYHVLADDAATPQARLVEVNAALELAHPAGSDLVERAPLIEVQALDAGRWGDRLRVSVEDEIPGLVARTTLRTVLDATHVRLASSSGVEAGTVLELSDPDTGEAVGDPLKVDHIDRTDYTLTLATALTAAQQTAASNAAAAGNPLRVSSREFRITVYLLRQPDPAQPSRNNTVIDSEIFRYLSMDSRHSRYVEAVIGAIDGDEREWDRRPEGASAYIRVLDLAPDEATEHSVRLGPETLVDVLPNGRVRAARHPLSGGDEALASLTDDHYVGEDAEEPLERTGLQSLRNIDEVSMVAVPGQISVSVQDALISHCEIDRYRFAVLDGPAPPADTLTDVQTQRQQFDTRYAALYHPWLLIPDPFPVNPELARTVAVPPSGHVMGIYARTDIERGVHKAPANEVVRGIRGLRRVLNKGEHDILNPSPVNINVIRDFRSNNRGIRVWGARVITSDPDFKYVNVRRLLIFLEESIDEGLQWVVFEPNAEPLWARVRRSISDFLRVVWRNGALEGTTEELAFFVKCDRTTMTQTDIDNGRLICLVGVAPVKPAEFVIIRIGLKTAEAES